MPVWNAKIQLVFVKRLAAFLATTLLATAAYRVPQSSSSTSTHSTSKTHSSAAGQRPTTVAKSSQRSRTRSGKSARAKRAPGPSYQLHPDPERYQEIQKALADRGYFKGQVNGVWGDDSVDAMKRFQTDQKLEQTDGKIDAQTLIGLGLGPKHDGSTAPGASTATSAPVIPPVPPATPADPPR
jgi:Putative peptidoglycan binding domain